MSMTNQAPASGQGISSELSFIDALKYPFDDKDWVKKVAIGAALTLTIIGGLAVAGYGVRLARRILRHEPGLPEWDDFGGDFSRGLHVLGGNLIHFSPIIFLACCLGVAQFALISPSLNSSIARGAANQNHFGSTLFS